MWYPSPREPNIYGFLLFAVCPSVYNTTGISFITSKCFKLRKVSVRACVVYISSSYIHLYGRCCHIFVLREFDKPVLVINSATCFSRAQISYKRGKQCSFDYLCRRNIATGVRSEHREIWSMLSENRRKTGGGIAGRIFSCESKRKEYLIVSQIFMNSKLF